MSARLPAASPWAPTSSSRPCAKAYWPPGWPTSPSVGSVAWVCARRDHWSRCLSRDGFSSASQPASPVREGDLFLSLSGERLGGRSVATDPFFSSQVKVVLERCGSVDPESLEDYVASGGYEALANAVTTMAPDDVIGEVVASGLRGRGGAGYPTGLKWRTVAKASAGAEGKFVVCNADEGDPGAFMDRSVLESCPQQVLEGMAIAGYAVGANKGYVYVRAEYPLAVKRLTSAIRHAEHDGFLGNDIAGTRFAFDVEVRIGAGAFVCGEETALIASIQGGRGTPRPDRHILQHRAYGVAQLS